MKKISYLILALLTGVLFISCRDSLSDVYSGPVGLHFSEGTSKSEVVLGGAEYKDVTIPFGTLKGIGSSASVSLVVDTANSTAVEGTQFTILQNPVSLSSGSTGGSFTVRILESGASSDAKKAVFKLSSSEIENAIFDQTYTLDMSLFCPVSSFVGDFSYAGFLGTSSSLQIEEGTEANTLYIKNWISSSYPIKLTYDTDGNVTFTAQETGYVHPTYGMITINPTPGVTSTFNTCTRTLTLYATYTVAAGSFGAKVETFTGN